MSDHVWMPQVARPAAVTAGREAARGWLGGLWARLVLMRRVAETRRELGRLDSRLLADMGLGRAEAFREAGRWPWDLKASGSSSRAIDAHIIGR